jgi:hypothetical protein
VSDTTSEVDEAEAELCANEETSPLRSSVEEDPESEEKTESRAELPENDDRRTSEKGDDRICESGSTS